MTGNGRGRTDAVVPDRVRVGIGLVGLAGLVVGAIAMYRGEDGAAPAAFITTGMALVALGILTPYFRSFKAGGIEIELLQRQVNDVAQVIAC